MTGNESASPKEEKKERTRTNLYLLFCQRIPVLLRHEEVGVRQTREQLLSVLAPSGARHASKGRKSSRVTRCFPGICSLCRYLQVGFRKNLQFTDCPLHFHFYCRVMLLLHNSSYKCRTYVINARLRKNAGAALLLWCLLP